MATAAVAAAQLLRVNRADAATADAATADDAVAIRGADLSFLLQEEAAGRHFSDAGRVRPAERILARHGSNWMRIRVWVKPPAGYSDLPSALILAERAKRVGMKVLLDLHYSDFWADPAHQSVPTAWAGQDLSTLVRTVENYTQDVVAAFAAQGTPIDMIQVGNEITDGLLWPLGQIYQSDGQHWEAMLALVNAGIAGARRASVHHRLQTMVHIDRGGDNGGSRYFFDNVLDRGLRFDVIGLSFYPFWHGPLSALAANLDDLASRYNKELVVVETAYPWTLSNGDGLENLLTTAAQLPDASLYPPAPDGQARYFESLRQILAAVPKHRGLGFFAWEPEWIPGVGWEPGALNPNDNLTMFDFEGRALPALRAFRGGR